MKRPRISEIPRNGRTVSDTAPASTLTANGTKSPASASTTCSAICSPALSCASFVLAPRCGVTTTVGRLEERRVRRRLVGEDVERGAADAAVADRLGERLLVDDPAAGGVHDAYPGLGPREQVACRMSPTVSGVFGRWIVMKSLRATRSSRLVSSTPIRRARSGATKGS